MTNRPTLAYLYSIMCSKCLQTLENSRYSEWSNVLKSESQPPRGRISELDRAKLLSWEAAVKAFVEQAYEDADD